MPLDKREIRELLEAVLALKIKQIEEEVKLLFKIQKMLRGGNKKCQKQKS